MCRARDDESASAALRGSLRLVKAVDPTPSPSHGTVSDGNEATARSIAGTKENERVFLERQEAPWSKSHSGCVLQDGERQRGNWEWAGPGGGENPSAWRAQGIMGLKLV